MRDKNLEIVSSAVKLAVPEIMELKMGCKVKYPTGHYFYHSTGRLGEYNLYDIECSYIHAKSSVGAKILGRPITLADVLIALGDKYIAFLDDFTLQTIKRWNLRVPLNDQPDETLAFLAPPSCRGLSSFSLA